jgi:hypothetical protein
MYVHTSHGKGAEAGFNPSRDHEPRYGVVPESCQTSRATRIANRQLNYRVCKPKDSYNSKLSPHGFDKMKTCNKQQATVALLTCGS